MKMRLAAATAAAFALALAAPAHADPDTDFAAELQGYGIYGPRDYNAWLGKLVCKRMDRGVDSDANKSVHFALTNLPKGTTNPQAWQFVGAAANTYCPEHLPDLGRTAGQ
ncbi:DUF732 domain-containing protein [Mycobacterium sp. pUA109]|uniref:DUF732 domain-containing protein n=1 Tax=Mycobacterium sp. pUA109 TaxID=3238982 RepID=UPI00351B3FD8